MLSEEEIKAAVEQMISNLSDLIGRFHDDGMQAVRKRYRTNYDHRLIDNADEKLVRCRKAIEQVISAHVEYQRCIELYAEHRKEREKYEQIRDG